MAAGQSVVIVGYASLDSSSSMREFRGVDATSILERAIVSVEPGIGGIAHLAIAVSAAGGPVDAISWVGNDDGGRAWIQAVAAQGSGTEGVVMAGTRTPSATLIEIGSGGTICFFDPGDCHSDHLTAKQVEVITSSDWVLLTVAPRSITTQLLDVLPAAARLVWAVKHDEDAYTDAMVRRILQRADIVSFSRGERSYLTVDGVAPESMMRPGSLAIETRGADGVAWCFAGAGGAGRHGALAVDRVDVNDTTGAGDTFVGTLVGLVSAHMPFETLSDEEVTTLVATASSAVGDLLRRRMDSGPSAGALQKEIH